MTETYIPDTIGDEIITLEHQGDRQKYEVRYGQFPTVRMQHVCIYDSPEWSPYTVMEKIDEPSFNPSIPNWAREFVVGQTFSLVRVVTVNDRVHCRLMRTPGGEARAILTRTLTDGDASYVSTVVDPSTGRLKMVRVFRRISS